MLKLCFLHAICHNSDTFRCILSGEEGYEKLCLRYKLKLVHLLVLLYELFIIVRTLVALRRK
jgi:hypothetical protein